MNWSGERQWRRHALFHGVHWNTPAATEQGGAVFHLGPAPTQPGSHLGRAELFDPEPMHQGPFLRRQQVEQFHEHPMRVSGLFRCGGFTQAQQFNDLDFFRGEVRPAQFGTSLFPAQRIVAGGDRHAGHPAFEWNRAMVVGQIDKHAQEHLLAKVLLRHPVAGSGAGSA